MAEGMEWVEIIEPRSKKHMYANLKTGECVWDQPVGQRVKKTDHNHWWELYDVNTERFYYYNATSAKTVWHRPENCDIIPLAKLQTLKQNTEVRDEETGKSRKRDSAATQTSSPNGESFLHTASGAKKNGQFERANTGSIRKFSSEKFSSETQTTPQSSPKDVKRHPSHHHHLHKCTPRSQADLAQRGEVAPVSVRRQPSTGLQQQQQQRTPTSRDPDYFEDVWSAGPERLPNSNNNTRLMVSSESGRTPSPRSPNHDVPMGSLPRGNHRLYENSAIAESENGFFNIEPSPSTSFAARNNPVIQLPRRQRSFDYKNGFLDNGETSLPFRAGRKENSYHNNPSMPSGIRSVESTPRVNRRNNSDAPLPQISELNTAQQIRQHQDAFAISGGTPMQSRKKRSVPKTNGTISASPQNSRLPTPSTPSGILHPTEIGSNSSHSQSSLDSRRSLFGQKQQQTTPQPPPQPVPSNFPIFAVPFSPPNTRQNWSPNANPPEPVMTSFNPMFGKSSQLRRTISVDRHDLKSPSSEASSKPPTPFSPQLHRRNTTKPTRISPNALEEDRKAEELLKATKDATKEYETITSFSSHRPQNGNRSFDRAPELRNKKPALPPQPTHHHSDADTDSEDNDADVEDSDECEDDEDDEDLDEIMALDSSGQNRYGHFSPSQLRMHPSYCVAIDRGIKSLHFDGTSGPNHSSDEDVENPYRDKLHNLVDTRHASLRRKINQPINGPKLSGLEKSQSVQTELALSAQQQPRPQSIIFPTQSEVSLSSTKSSSPVCRPFYPGLNNGSSTLTRDRAYVSAERDSGRSAEVVKLNDHTKGIFRKKVSISSLLSWSKDAINKPLIMTSDKSVKKEACTMFRLVQMYMGDRKAKENKSQDEIALDLTRSAWQKASLRDELFIQICKQTTENRKPESLRRGWELMAICLAFFPPSANFFAYLHTYISRFQSPACDTFEVQVSHYASHSLKRLERMSQTGAKRGIRKPTVEEIQQARVQIFHPSMFGNTLEDVMQLQKERFPDRRLPWVQTILSDEIQRLHGLRTEGIFRVPGDIDEVNMLKVRMDRWNSPDCCDPHVPSSLLKLWYRELYEPLIPARFYDLCIQNCNNPAMAVQIVEQLPAINRLVLTYLINFLQDFAQPDNVVLTKMDAPNLAMVMAPNCLRCMSDDPQVIFENTRKEMSFIRTLMQNLETAWIEGMR